jgi:hypothetical protein
VVLGVAAIRFRSRKHRLLDIRRFREVLLICAEVINATPDSCEPGGGLDKSYYPLY